MACCIIYVLRNTVNDKVYVGQTWEALEKRWKNGNGYNNCVYIHRAITKHGAGKFYYEVVGMTSSQDNADYLESMFIEQFDSLNREKGYNLDTGGSHGKRSAETKQKLSDANKGKILSDEHKQKIGAANTGKKRTEEMNIALSERLKQSGITPPSFSGRRHSIESRMAISASTKGKEVSLRTRTILSDLNRGSNNPNFGKTLLTPRQMTEVRNSELSERKLAKIYGVSRTTINRIKKDNNV